jgi:hypothetical protein
MADTIIDGTQFNVQNIKYTSPKANSSGGKNVNILNKTTNTGIRISTPLLRTWGASDFQDPQTGKGNGKFEMSLQFPSGEYKNADTDAFLKNIQAFEQKIKEDALTYSKEWFGKVHKNAEVVEALYTPILKYSKDKVTGDPDLNKAPTLRVKIPSWEGAFKVEVYDDDFQKLFPNTENPLITPMELIQKGTDVAALIQCGGIWFANGKFGVTWKLVQVVVQKPRATTLSGQCFIKLKSVDKEKLKSAVSHVVDVVDQDDVPLRKNVEEVEDSDEEEEEATPEVKIAVADVKAEVKEEVKTLVETSIDEEPKKKKVVKKKVAAAVE